MLVKVSCDFIDSKVSEQCTGGWGGGGEASHKMIQELVRAMDSH